MDSPQWMIYGANGFSGSLIAREAVRQNLQPILAGRNKKAVTNLARELNLESRIFALNELEQIPDIKLILNCAGPFKDTAQILAEFCIAEGINYLDISGDYFAFKQLLKLSDLAKKKNITLLPGVGFFVAASDCLFHLLKKELSVISSIDLFIIVDSQFRFNSGSIKSMKELLNDLQANIKNDSFLFARKKIEVDGQEISGISLPLPDLLTGKISTGTDNIKIYGYFCSWGDVFDKFPLFLSNYLLSFWGSSVIQKIVTQIIEIMPRSSPDIHQVNSGVTLVGVAYYSDGTVLQKKIDIVNPYIFTQRSSLALVKKILKKTSYIPPGFQTPTSVFGEGLLSEISENTKQGVK
jgi:short subunit dehydrogenase-like uncharacterized protein